MADLEGRLLCDVDIKHNIWWRYIDHVFLIWKHGEKSLKFFLERTNSIQTTIKSMAEWSYISVIF